MTYQNLSHTMGCHCHTHSLHPPQIVPKKNHSITPKKSPISSLNHQNQQLKQQIRAPNTDALRTVKLQTLGDCKLGIARYPDFDYSADGGAGVGTAAEDDLDGQLVSVEFDVQQLYIPPLSSLTTKLFGLPLPPFLRIDIVPEALGGKIDQHSGKVDLKLKAKFWFSAGSVYKAPPLLVETVLTSEESTGKMRGGKGKRLDKEGRCRLVGVATVEPVNDLFMDTFLGLPTECLATLNAIISFPSTSE